jgi:hypothetical protein
MENESNCDSYDGDVGNVDKTLNDVLYLELGSFVDIQGTQFVEMKNSGLPQHKKSKYSLR